MNVVNSLKQGTDALKKMNELLKLEDIEKLMEDSREAIDYQNVRMLLPMSNARSNAIYSRKYPMLCLAA